VACPVLRLTGADGARCQPLYLITNSGVDCTTHPDGFPALGPTPTDRAQPLDKAMSPSNDFGARLFRRNAGGQDNSYFFRRPVDVDRRGNLPRTGFDVRDGHQRRDVARAAPMSHIGYLRRRYTGDATGPVAGEVEFMPWRSRITSLVSARHTLRARRITGAGPLHGQRRDLPRWAVCTNLTLQLHQNRHLLQSFRQRLDFWAGGVGFRQIALSWETTVIGDPLYQPFNKAPPELPRECT